MPKGHYDRTKFHGDLSGLVYGELTVIGRANGSEGRSVYRCACSCGKDVEVQRSRLIKGATRSCGHLVGKASVTHNMTNTSTYAIWRGMLARCLRTTAKDYPMYGGRWITVCEEWARSFERFVADMGVRPDGESLDRIDGSKGYYKENCRWATWQQQAGNRSSSRYVHVDGVKMCMAHAARMLGLSNYRMKVRVDAGETWFYTTK